MRPLLFVMGPTGSGKSGLALALAQHFPLELLNADSVQVYRGLEIGSAKPSLEERAQVPHHLLDLAEPDETFSAGRYREAALRVIQACHERGRLPALVGGTGLYLRAVEQGLVELPPIDPEITAALRAAGQKLGWPCLHAELAQHDPELAARLPQNDSQRITRGLAVWRATGQPLTAWQRQQPKADPAFAITKLALNWPRDRLYQRIDDRFDQMLAAGLLAEVTALWNKGYDRELPAMKAVGYRQLFLHLDGHCSLDEAVALAKQESRRYAKRQLTWLRREEPLHWIDPDHQELATAQVATLLRHHPLQEAVKQEQA